MKPRAIAIFFGGVILSLVLLSKLYPHDGISIGSHTYYFPSLHSLVDKDQREIELKAKTVPPEITQLSDSIRYFKSLVDEGDLRFWLPDSTYLDGFWQAAEAAKRNNIVVRIIHYGDSQIEMDRISSRLRSHMQELFGGGGPGMLPFQTIIPSHTVMQSTWGTLIHLSSFGDSTVVRSRGNYGPMMQSFRLEGDASVTVRAGKGAGVDERAKNFSNIKLVFRSRCDAFHGELTNLATKETVPLKQHDGTVGSMLWTLEEPTSSFRLKVSGNADLYCLTVDNGPGVAVDNIPMRGCSGQQFTYVNENLLTEAYGQLNVGMIIMQFAGNSVPYLKTTEQVSTYCTSMGKQIDYVHKCCPNAKILFIGPSDMSTRIRDALQTYPIIPSLIDSLASTAVRHGAAFWSIYHAMGGENSMTLWNKKGLAGMDYIHFSQQGADLMGDRLAEAFTNSYRLYCMQRKLKQYEEENNP